MSWFDLPYNKYGMYFNPEEIVCECDENQVKQVEQRADELKINHFRAFFRGKKEAPTELLMVERLSPGPVSYFPQYNCLRSYGWLRLEGKEMTTFEKFMQSLMIHPWNQ